jgi:hypothetical protein
MQTELLDGCLGAFRIQKVIHISVARFARPIEAKARAFCQARHEVQLYALLLARSFSSAK